VQQSRAGEIAYPGVDAVPGPIRQFVGIRAKMYSIRCVYNKYDKVKAKGIIKAYRLRKLRHKDFVRALRNKKTTNAKFWPLQGSKNETGTLQLGLQQRETDQRE